MYDRQRGFAFHSTAGGKRDLCNCTVRSTTERSWSSTSRSDDTLATHEGVSDVSWADCAQRAVALHFGYYVGSALWSPNAN